MEKSSSKEKQMANFAVDTNSTRSYNFSGLTNCTVNVYEEGKAIEILNKKEDLAAKNADFLIETIGSVIKIGTDMISPKTSDPISVPPVPVFTRRKRSIVKKAGVKPTANKSKVPAKKVTKKPRKK